MFKDYEQNLEYLILNNLEIKDICILNRTCKYYFNATYK